MGELPFVVYSSYNRVSLERERSSHQNTVLR